MTLRKLTASTTDASNRSWTILWTIFTGGWWKFWRRETLLPWANILTPCPLAKCSGAQARIALARPRRFSRKTIRSRIAVIAAATVLPLVMCSQADAQTRHKKKARPKSAGCQTGCKPDTSTPDVATSSPDDAASLKELSGLARNLKNATPGAYDRLAAFA